MVAIAMLRGIAMYKHCKGTILGIAFTLLIVACTSPIAASPATITPIVTMTPEVIVTPTPFPTKTVLIQYGIFGGDGGLETDFYLGRDIPVFVLYTDGQLIRYQNDKSGFETAKLTLQEMCYFLTRIEATGFFEIQSDGLEGENSPIYKFDTPVSFGDGFPHMIVQINGNKPGFMYIEIPYYDNLIKEVKSTIQLIKTYRPQEDTTYVPRHLLLWIEKGRGLALESDIPKEWPTDLTPLEQLWENRIPNPNLYETYHTLVEGNTAEQIYKYFGNKLQGGLFIENGIEYYVIVRPLLPHETPDNLSPFPWKAQKFDLPFRCNK